MSEQVSLHSNIHGHVQGVFFRAYVEEKAIKLGLTGYVRNLPTGQDVEVKAEGKKEQLDKLIEYLKIGPPSAQIESVTITWSQSTGRYHDFQVRN